MSCNTSSTRRQKSHDHNRENGSSSHPPSCYGIVGDCLPCWCSVSGCGVWQKSVVFQNVGRCPQLALVYFLSLQSTYGQSFSFPYKSKLRNALLHSRSGCLQIQTLSSAALLPVTLNTVWQEFINIVLESTSLQVYTMDPMQKRLKRKVVRRRRWLW